MALTFVQKTHSLFELVSPCKCPLCELRSIRVISRVPKKENFYGSRFSLFVRYIFVIRKMISSLKRGKKAEQKGDLREVGTAD